MHRKLKTLNVKLKGINDLFQANLIEIPFAKLNRLKILNNCILTMINCFSKYVFAVPLKTKLVAEIVKSLIPIFKTHKMKNLQTDRGKEKFNLSVKILLQVYHINHYSTFSERPQLLVVLIIC